MDFRILAAPLLLLTLYGTFRGFWYEGFELSHFISCDAPRTLPWLLRLPDAGRFPTEAVGIASVSARAWQTVAIAPYASLGHQDQVRYVEVRGRLVGPNAYGVWGNNEFGLDISDVILARAPRPSDCPAVNRSSWREDVRVDTVAIIVNAWREEARRLDVRRREPGQFVPRAAELSIPTTFIPNVTTVSVATFTELARRGLPVRDRHRVPWAVEKGSEFSVKNLWATRTGRVRVVMLGGWYTPADTGGFQYYLEASDTIWLDARTSRVIPPPASRTP